MGVDISMDGWSQYGRSKEQKIAGAVCCKQTVHPYFYVFQEVNYV